MTLEASHLAVPADAVATSPSAAADDPLWYKDAVIYQVHVKAFFDSNNDGVGDFRGLTQKLDYLQGLGVTCLWLLPFYPSPLKDDGYDIADYMDVHRSYGTLDDFKAFVLAAHDRHIRVLIELVINHTSDQHPWFERARQAPPESPERAFYVWSDTDTKFPETRIIFLDTEKSNWTFDPIARQYYWHRFFSHQPDLNLNNPRVVEAVIDVMKFWLDLGVDALRLDAVPYLCVREGSINENLPETHEVLKRIRRELDAAYPNRMLLAEANQWPSDVRAYFGEGDECHMAFHFPLMPRMFMAIQQEDRHAITEILNQTPDIPDTCQWALFLRNHDELTLEMVTDEERDYMYSVYAADPQMRLNRGIRRRLAPLLENSRRRIELMTSLLFAFPGTPILYYGDDIGMGDNIYLGDRNGVRTPMQWSGDRNAGFSRADPARLYAPLIMDPVYGYQSINVEAQERYPFSLLNWMKRLIAMRKQHRVLGRGTIEIIYGPNRKVLSFLRRDEHETILVVANLSRSVQPAEIDLQAFSGLIPVEMWGMTEFPRISDHPYFLTLGPYASYWFSFQQEPMQLAPRATAGTDARGRIVDSLPLLLAGAEWQAILDSGVRTILERQALQPFLQRQRWFGSKTRTIRRARFLDWARIKSGAEPAFLSIVSVEYADGWKESYVLPLALLSGNSAERALDQSPGIVLARLTGARRGVIVDGMYDTATCEHLHSIATDAREVVTTAGSVHGRTRLPAAAKSEAAASPAPRTWTLPPGDQSNSIAVSDDERVLKLFRRTEPGLNPEYEISSVLAEQRFPRTPALLGALEYNRPGFEPGSIAIVQKHVTHQGTGWQYTIDELRRYYERVSARSSGAPTRSEFTPAPNVPASASGRDSNVDPSPFFLATQNWYLRGAALLGKRTAELHLALAAAPEPAFVPVPIGIDGLCALADGMEAHAAATFELLNAQASTLPEPLRAQAESLLANRDALVGPFGELRRLSAAGMLIRVHGDYHLGQVLRTEEDFFIVDFEGESARTLADRRAKQSPLKDVAGMVRSYSYAAYTALFTFALHAPDDFATLEPWAREWHRWVAEAFVREYRTTLGPSPIVPDQDDSFSAMLRALTLDKALYELAYELNNRPEWVRIPLMALLTMAPSPATPPP
jgi:maltose alpha-D-glucosyltransferase / alpha-amylase